MLLASCCGADQRTISAAGSEHESVGSLTGVCGVLQDGEGNKAFLDDINKGRVPAEFADEKDPYVSLIDKGTQDFEAPSGPAAARTFVGAGHSLGGSSAAATAAAAGATVQAPTQTITVDESAPITTIQVPPLCSHILRPLSRERGFNCCRQVGFAGKREEGVLCGMWTLK